MIDPKFLCRKHLLGEHLECHMLNGCLTKGKSLKGFIENGLIEIRSLYKRHNFLAKEMERRGYNHRTPIIPSEKWAEIKGTVDRKKSINDLTERCYECRKRIEKEGINLFSSII